MRWDKNLKFQIPYWITITIRTDNSDMGGRTPTSVMIQTLEGTGGKDTLSDKQKLVISFFGKWRINRENQMCFIKRSWLLEEKKSIQVRNKSMILQIYWCLKWYVLLKQVHNPELNALVEPWDMGWGIWMMGLKGYHKLNSVYPPSVLENVQNPYSIKTSITG